MVGNLRLMPFFMTPSILHASNSPMAENPFVASNAVGAARVAWSISFRSSPFPKTHHSHCHIEPIKLLEPVSITSFPSAFKKASLHVLEPKLKFKTFFISLKWADRYQQLLTSSRSWTVRPPRPCYFCSYYLLGADGVPEVPSII